MNAKGKSMTDIIPTVGRVIWFYPAADDTRLQRDNDHPLAGIIAMVRDDGMLNLMVVAQDGHPVGRIGVPLVQDLSGANVNVTGSYATWMPYQTGQAAKQEELQREMKAQREQWEMEERQRARAFLLAQ